MAFVLAAAGCGWNTSSLLRLSAASRRSVESLDVGSNLVVGVRGVERGRVEMRRPVGVVLEVVDWLQTQFGHGHGSELA